MQKQKKCSDKEKKSRNDALIFTNETRWQTNKAVKSIVEWNYHRHAGKRTATEPIKSAGKAIKSIAK